MDEYLKTTNNYTCQLGNFIWVAFYLNCLMGDFLVGCFTLIAWPVILNNQWSRRSDTTPTTTKWPLNYTVTLSSLWATSRWNLLKHHFNTLNRYHWIDVESPSSRCCAVHWWQQLQILRILESCFIVMSLCLSVYFVYVNLKVGSMSTSSCIFFLV